MKIRNRVLAVIMSSAMVLSTVPTASLDAEAAGSTGIGNLAVNYQEDAAGVETGNTLRFSWNMSSEVQGQEQVSYKIDLYKDGPNGAFVWTSGTVDSSKSSGIAYEIEGLEKENGYSWTVTVRTKDGQTIVSEPADFITDTDLSDTAWIIPEQVPGGSMPLLRTEQKLESKKVESAYLYISAMGIYQAYIDGQQVRASSGSSDIFNPGWTDYKYYTNYQTYEVTDYIKDDTLTMGVELGNGWYAGKVGNAGSYQGVFGADDSACELGLIAKLAIHYEDGSTQYIKTDAENWKSSTYSPVTANDFFDGETYDENIAEEISGWNNDGYLTGEADQWDLVTEGVYKGELRSGTKATARIADEYDRMPVKAYTYKDNESLTAEQAGNDYGAIKEHAVAPGGTISLKKGEKLIADFGQNAAGAVQLTVNGKKGTAVTMDHAEMLNDGRKNPELETGGSDGATGTLYKKAITNAQVTDQFILSDEGTQEFLPKFTFHGFRYVQITADADIQIKGMVGKVYTSVGDQTGYIETNDSDINQLFSNTLWSQKSNYLSLPTDCPQRGERAGWTGDAQLFAATGVYTYDVFAFLENYSDMMQEHAKNNGNKYGAIMPTSFVGFFASTVASGWSDAGVIIPWVLYQQTGDTTLIENYYSQMDAYMDVVRTDGYNPQLFGDWLAFSGASTPYLNTVYEIYCTDLMKKMASVLGKEEFAKKYQDRCTVLKSEFMKKYVDADGNVLSSTADNVTISNHKYPVIDNAQTAILWALKCGLYADQKQRDQMIANLLKNIKNENGSVRSGYEENTLSVGFLGVNVILPVLSDIGAADVAYDLLLQDALPSWLYSVKNGATTIWERWNSYSSEKSFGDSSMNSFNHYSYGACVEWMFKYMGGISQDEANPGFQKIILQPEVDESGRISYVNSAYDSLYGRIVSNWQSAEGKMSAYHVEIPANTSAVMYLEISSETAQQLAKTAGVTFDGMTRHNNKETAKFTLLSGAYDFTDFTEKTPAQPVKVSKVTMNKKSADMFVKDTLSLKATVVPAEAENKSLNWTSSNPSVAAVTAEGKVTARKKGTAVITASAADGSNQRASCKITVKKPTVKLNASSAKLQVKKSTRAVKATGLLKGDKISKWTTSSKSVAVVDKKGKITAKKPGKAIITVYTKKGASAKLSLSVTRNAVKTTSVKANVKSLSLKKGKTYQLSVTRKPVTAVDKISFVSSNKNVAKVNTNGRITAKKKGITVITVKTSNQKSCKVRVQVK